MHLLESVAAEKWEAIISRIINICPQPSISVTHSHTQRNRMHELRASQGPVFATFVRLVLLELQAASTGALLWDTVSATQMLISSTKTIKQI